MSTAGSTTRVPGMGPEGILGHELLGDLHGQRVVEPAVDIDPCQADTEQADLARERGELADDPAAETEELARIYVDRGLAEKVAAEVRAAWTGRAVVKSEMPSSSRAWAPRASGAALPLLVAVVSPANLAVYTVSGASLVFLAVLGALGAARKTSEAPDTV
jgi:hypothetical protein